MTPDYDLSSLRADEADLWMYLRVNAILADILADQPERRASPLALGASTLRCSSHCASDAAGGTQQSKTGSRLMGVRLGNEKVN